MKIALPIVAIGIVALAGVATTVPAQAAGEHKIVTPEQVEWGPRPASLPEGTQAVALFGDPTRRGCSPSESSSRRATGSRPTGIRGRRS